MRPRWMLPIVLAVVIMAGAAGVAARAVYTRPVETSETAVPPQGTPPAEEPGDATVTATADAAAHPLYGIMRGLLQTYFDSINGRHYDRWLTVVSARRALREPEGDWRIAYRSTKDGSIVMHRIETGQNRTALILLSFTSVQELRDAPHELPERCIRWKIVLPMANEEGAWKVDSGPTGAAPQHEKC